MKNNKLPNKFVIITAFFLAVIASVYSYASDYMLAYGDAESHLNIAKRVTDSLTPGLAQLGGIWLPLPHLMLVPFTNFDIFWRTGIAGALVSGVAYIVAGYFLYKIVILTTANKIASLFAFLVFALNPNILYLQSTAMTEVLLIAFFMLSTYYFIKFLKDDGDASSLVISAFFSFCATLSRYDGWFLVLVQVLIIIIYYAVKIKWGEYFKKGRLGIQKLKDSKIFPETEGKVILFSTLAFAGILLWFLWGYLILNDPLYFTSSPFSAKSQQNGWLAQGQLPAYQNLQLSYLYYATTTFISIGNIATGIAIVGLIVFLLDTKIKQRFFIALLFFIPFIFYVITLYLGQSVIFIPELTSDTFEWRLFNVRYGVMMIPAAAFFIGYLINRIPLLFSLRNINQKKSLKYLDMILKVPAYLLVIVVLAASFFQNYLFLSGKEKAISLEDAKVGLSAASVTDAQYFLADTYDGGLVLIDDFARTLSVIKSGIPMNNVIYVGNKPFWEESLEEPEKHARWIIMQEGDAVWTNIYEDADMQGRLYKYFERVYTSPDILVFRKSDNDDVLSSAFDKQ